MAILVLEFLVLFKNVLQAANANVRLRFAIKRFMRLC
jgi:hypothetical protein